VEPGNFLRMYLKDFKKTTGLSTLPTGTKKDYSNDICNFKNGTLTCTPKNTHT
jgi:hypothetical protein